MAVYAIVISLAAFLLFQIQPLIAKIILPWFGGTSAVWSTCMLFFQVALLLGYLYAHWLHERLAARTQALVHTALLLASLALLPVAPGPSWKGAFAAHPAWQILGLLAVTVGLPYFLLSTTSPLLQSWYARTHAGAVPYRLFALSNSASMLGLLTYPLFVEPNLSTRMQSQVWSAGYACFALVCAAAAWRAARSPSIRSAVESPAAGPAAYSLGWRLCALWVVLPATASILLLSITTYLTQDVAAVPFLWILPLAVYLLSFIICFEASRFYRRAVYLPLLVAALGLVAYMLLSDRETFMLVPTVALTVAALFVFCMVCHGELVRLKPPPRYLTMFYLMLSLGGALGGLFVGLIAPSVFNGYYEFPAGLALCAGLTALLLLSDYRAFFRRPRGRLLALAMLAGLAGYAVALGFVISNSVNNYRVVARNFYGQLRIEDVDDGDGAGMRRRLINGVINHGEQILSPQYRNRPGTYYCAETAVGRVLLAGKQGVPRRIGILGLGCGTLAAYGRPGDTLRIYEINPLVLDLARSQFTYLRDSKARVEIVLGDARLSLEHEPGQHFELLVVDAFSGDSVPVHLLTREAVRTYLRHLAPGGILAVNISNKYLELRPVLERAASYFRKVAIYAPFTEADDDLLCFGASWVLIVDRASRQGMTFLPSEEVLASRPDFRLWTDDFSSLYQVLR